MTTPLQLGSPPNLAPNGVIQNPGIGEIMGGGLSQLAQFLQAKQQAEQQRQLAMAQLGQGQQKIDLDRSAQATQAPLTAAQTTETSARAAQLQQQTIDAAKQMALKIAATQNFGHYINAGPNGEPPAALNDLGSQDRVSAWQRMYAVDPQGTVAKFQDLLGKEPIQLAPNARLINPLSMATQVAAQGEPQKPSDEYVNAFKSLYGNTPMNDPSIGVPELSKVYDKMLESKIKTANAAAPKAADAFATALGSERVKDLTARFGDAQQTSKDVAVARDALYNLQNNGVRSGPLATANMTMDAFLGDMGFKPDARDPATQKIMSDLAARVLPSVREQIASGSGGVPRLNTTEINLVQKTVGDLTKMPVATLQKLLQDAVTTGAWKIAKYKSWVPTLELDKVSPGATAQYTDVDPNNFAPPSPTAPTTTAGGADWKAAEKKRLLGGGP